MSQSLLVFILSVLVFVAGALFINYTVKREDARQGKGDKTVEVSSDPVSKTA